MHVSNTYIQIIEYRYIHNYHTGAAAQRVPIPNHIFLRLCSQLQSSTRVLRNMKIPPSFDFTFHWENEQQY